MFIYACLFFTYFIWHDIKRNKFAIRAGQLKINASKLLFTLSIMFEFIWKMSSYFVFFKIASTRKLYIYIYIYIYIHIYWIGQYHRGYPRGVMVKAMDCGIVVSSFSSCATTFTFRPIHLGKVSTPLSSRLWVK